MGVSLQLVPTFLLTHDHTAGECARVLCAHGPAVIVHGPGRRRGPATWEASRRADWIAEMFAYDVDREAVAFGEDGPSGKSTVTQSRV